MSTLLAMLKRSSFQLESVEGAISGRKAALLQAGFAPHPDGGFPRGDPRERMADAVAGRC
jgi:hypothetical protein